MIRHYYETTGRTTSQSKCQWCGKLLNSTDDCLTEPQRIAMRSFSRLNGGHWKRKLSNQWMDGTADELLIQVRNIIGPAGLAKLEAEFVRNYQTPK